jgi:hypothetical protein
MASVSARSSPEYKSERSQLELTLFASQSIVCVQLFSNMLHLLNLNTVSFQLLRYKVQKNLREASQIKALCSSARCGAGTLRMTHNSMYYAACF